MKGSAARAEEEEKHLDWSAKQGRILTDRGKALEYYSEKNGFPFSAEVTSSHVLGHNFLIHPPPLTKPHQLGMPTLSPGTR